ncbi:MAG: outer membrane protein assembly factor BamA [Candidatus Marinimicrobia bacterium]|nr:outer membrane protein assembly factor BamA [Candidatus Neomarinimicrobiota bacterium]
MIKNIIAILFCTSIIFSQSQELVVLGVDVEGNRRLTQEDIMRNARLYEGMTIRGDEIQKSIKRLWKINRFGDIQIFVTEETEDGVYLLVKVSEFPTLESYSFSGNKKSKRTLDEEIELTAGQVLTDKSLFDAMQSLREFYISKHFHNVEIDTVLTKGEDINSQKVEFVISEGKKLKITEIEVNGNESISDFRLKWKLKETKSWHWYTPWRGKWDKTKFDEDIKLITSFYRNNGYRDFYIVNESIEEVENGFKLILDIYEGPQYSFRNFTWNGNRIHSSEDLQKRLGFERGDLFNDIKFQMAVSEKVSPLYMDEGYFYFQIDSQIQPIGEDSLDVHFEIVENEIVKVRKIIIGGNEKTHENVVRRELRVFPGDIFSRKKLLDSYRDVFMLNFFDNVLPNVVPIDEDEIDITIDVLEKSTGQANLSMGYNELHGFTGGGGFEFPNFRGRGQTLSISYNRGLTGQNSSSTGSTSSYSSPYSSTSSANQSSYQSFSVSYTEPWLFDTPNLVGISFFYTEKGQGNGNYLPFDIKQMGGSARWGRRFKWPDPFFRGSWMIKSSNNTYYADYRSDLTGYFGSTVENLIEEDGLKSLFKTSGVSFTQIITRDNRDHPEFPTRGSKFMWTSLFSGSFLGGDEDYHKHVFDFKWFSPLMRKFIMHQSIKLGALKTIPVSSEERSVVPPSGRFVMGGTGMPYGEMLRGYEENSVGPDGYYNAGNVMLKYSMEFRLSLSESPTIYALAFAEAGNVWEDFDSVDPFNLKRSAGVGVRLFMPMLGMLGYDMGYGFDNVGNFENDGPRGWEHHLIFGMPF